MHQKNVTALHISRSRGRKGLLVGEPNPADLQQSVRGQLGKAQRWMETSGGEAQNVELRQCPQSNYQGKVENLCGLVLGLA